MDGSMDGWMDGQMDGQMDGWTDDQMDGWMDGWMDGRRDAIEGIQKQMNGWIQNGEEPSLVFFSLQLSTYV